MGYGRMVTDGSEQARDVRQEGTVVLMGVRYQMRDIDWEKDSDGV